MPKLEPLLTFHADLRAPIDCGPGPRGTRRIWDVVGGTFEGPRLSGTVLPSGADWLLENPDGSGHLDVRATLRCNDGAFVYVQYRGVLTFNEAVTAKLGRGEPTEFGDSYFMTTPRFETGHPEYAWLNNVVTVAEGRMLPGAVEYRVFLVAND